VDVNDQVHIGLSYAIVGTVSLAYLIQGHSFEFDSLSGWKDDKKGKATDYNIVAPIGIALIKRRASERFVSENSTFIHYTIVGVINSVIWLVGIRYFIVEGTWDWGTPSPIGVLNALLGVTEYR
jgi:hypothetical protein